MSTNLTVVMANIHELEKLYLSGELTENELEYSLIRVCGKNHLPKLIKTYFNYKLTQQK